jgi:tripartite-type tricarboxylate transporter receptor subunit TctC
MSNPKSRSRRRLVVGAASAVAVIGLPQRASAQAFPAKPIRLICPWPAGGSTDAVMRALGDSAGKLLGGQFVVENKAGASGMLGPNELVSARPDGYTLSQITIGVARLPHMQKMQFDPLKDFTYIVHADRLHLRPGGAGRFAVQDHQGRGRLRQGQPRQAELRIVGAGHDAAPGDGGVCLPRRIQLQHIPFKGFADGMQAMLGGHTMAHSDSTGWAPHVQAGTARLLATYGSKRAKRFPSVPTLTELGYETISDSPFGIGGPKGMDPERHPSAA